MREQKWTVISAVSDFLPQLFVCSHRKNQKSKSSQIALIEKNSYLWEPVAKCTPFKGPWH